MGYTRTFEKICEALEDGPRYIDNRGGARSGKTVAECQLFSLLARYDKTPTITSIVSESLPHLKRGIIRDFRDVGNDEGWWNEARWSKSECIYTFPSGSIIEFFGADNPAKFRGPGRHRLAINEANRVEWEAARQLILRTSGLVMYDYNPSAPFWGTEILPTRDRYKLVHSTYLDNQFLPDEVRRELEANKDTGNWWNVYGLGLIGQVEGQIFDFKIVDELPEGDGWAESWGLDFGFSHDPTTVIRIKMHTGRREIYADELLWQTGMTNPEIAAALRSLANGATPTVWADSAEPKSIEEIQRFGWQYIEGADKRIAVREQIQQLRAWTIYVTRRSVHLIDEGRKYLYKQLPDGTFTNEPIDFFNHGIDALRYAAVSPMGRYQEGQYSFSKTHRGGLRRH